MSVRAIEAEVSIKSGVQAECTIGRGIIVEVHDDVNLESLEVTTNGSYLPAQGVDGWDRVTVAVPERVPVTEPLSVTANGNYTPSHGVDGFSDVTVQVPERVPVTESLSVTENGTYEPSEGIDGYDRVTVSVPERVPVTESLTATSNGTYEPDSGVDGYDRVTVSVPEREPDIESLTVTSTGTYTASGDGYNPVTVNVPERKPIMESLSVTANGTYTPPAGVDGFDSVTVNLPAPVPFGMTLDWADVQEVTIGPNSVSNTIDAQTYLSSFAYTFLILKDALTVNNQLVFAGSNNLGTSITGAYRCRNNTIGLTGISASYDCKLVEGSVYYAIIKKTS